MKIVEQSPNDIEFRWQPTAREVAYQRDRLVNEGQIEPIELNRSGHRIAKRAWAYAEAQVQAARELNWPTLLVAY